MTNQVFSNEERRPWIARRNWFQKSFTQVALELHFLVAPHLSLSLMRGKKYTARVSQNDLTAHLRTENGLFFLLFQALLDETRDKNRLWLFSMFFISASDKCKKEEFWRSWTKSTSSLTNAPNAKEWNRNRILWLWRKWWLLLSFFLLVAWFLLLCSVWNF